MKNTRFINTRENEPGGDGIVTHFVQMENMRFALSIVESYANRCGWNWLDDVAAYFALVTEWHWLQFRKEF